MKRYVLSKEADDDILRIGRASVERWGWDRTERYVGDLHLAFEMLADSPALGRAASHIRMGIAVSSQAAIPSSTVRWKAAF